MLENRRELCDNKEERDGAVQSTPTPPLTTSPHEVGEMAASKSSAKAPAFQFYTKDFIADSNQMAMSLHEAGAYIRLMCRCWDDGSIPDDADRLARIIGASVGQMRKVWPAIRHCFREQPRDSGRMVHPRLERERLKQAEYRRRQSDRATKRWDRKDDAAAMPRHTSGIASAMQAPHASGNALLSSSSSSSSSSTAVPTVKNTVGTRASGTNPSEFAPEVLARISPFLERYQALYQEHRNGAHYLVHPQKDFIEAGLLCRHFPDDRLEKMAVLWLTTDDEFAASGSRNLAQFRSRASWCDSRLRERGL